MATSSTIPKDKSTETRIKDAARTLFTQKGFADTKTREIAEAAGINLALLNYYFRSKEKLYDLIMEENMASFKHGISELFGNPTMDVYEKIDNLANYYIDEFIANRDLPMFILNTMHGHSKGIQNSVDEEGIGSSRLVFVNQLKELVHAKKIKPIHPAHIISNLVGLILFPFLISPMLKKRARITDKEFVELMNERKKLIPIWIKDMLKK